MYVCVFVCCCAFAFQEKFPDETDHIKLGGFNTNLGNRIRDHHILFLACFANNEATMSQYHAIVCLCESFVETLTIVLPFYVSTQTAVLRFMFYVLRFTFYVLRFTFYVLRFTFYVLRFTF